MNRKRIVAYCIILAVMVVAIFAVFGLFKKNDLKSAGADNVAKKLRISVIMPHKDDGYWSYIIRGVNHGGRQYEDRVDVKVYIPQLNYNVRQMTELIKRQIAARVDVIVVQGNENAQYKEELKKAWKQGIQIVLVDTDIEDFIPHVYIGTDNYKAGEEMGKRLAKLTGGKANIAVLSGEADYGNLENRYRGLLFSSQKYPSLNFIRLDYDNYDALTVINRINQIKKENPEVDTLVCIEGTGGQTIGAHFTKQQKCFDHIIAFDVARENIEGIRSGLLDGLIAQEPYQMGLLTVKEVAEGRYEKLKEEKKIHTRIKWITKESLEQGDDSHGE